MRQGTLSLTRAGALVAAVPIFVGIVNAPISRAQASGQDASATSRFEVASIKPSSSGNQANSNFPLGPGDVYIRNGGLFSAIGFPLTTYIFFAYKLNGNQ